MIRGIPFWMAMSLSLVLTNHAAADADDTWAALLREHPPVSDVVHAALKHSELFRRGPGRWEGRARVKAVLPTFDVSLSRDLRDGTSLDTSRSIFGSAATRKEDGTYGNIIEGPDDRTFRESNSRDTTVKVSARWYLDELVFSYDELRAARESQNLVEMRSTIARQVVELYFARLKALVWLRQPAPISTLDRAEKQLQADRAAAELDALTGGTFSSEIEKRKN